MFWHVDVDDRPSSVLSRLMKALLVRTSWQRQAVMTFSWTIVRAEQTFEGRFQGGRGSERFCGESNPLDVHTAKTALVG